MFKKILLLTAMTGLVTACGGSGGGSDDRSDGSSGGGSDGGNKPNPQLTVNTTKMAYLSVLHGERSSSSTFTQQNLKDVKDSKLTITPTDSAKKVSILAQCEGSSQEKTLHAFDLVVDTVRTLPLDCASLNPPNNNKHNLRITDSTGIDSSSPYSRIGYVIGGMDVYRGTTWARGDYYIPTTSNTNTRTVWALSWYTDVNDGGYYMYETTNEKFGNTTASRGYNPSISSGKLNTVASPDSNYSLMFYSPSRFTQGLIMNNKSYNNRGAALINSDKLKDGDYYIESWEKSGKQYQHYTSTPKGAALFGEEGTYKGVDTVDPTYWIDSTAKTLNFSSTADLTTDIKIRGFKATATHTIVDGVASTFYTINHQTDSNTILYAFTDLLTATNGHTLTTTLTAMAPSSFDTFSTSVQALFDNRKEGEGQITVTYSAKSSTAK